MRAPDRQKAVAMGLALGVSLLLAALPGRAEPVAVRSGEHPGMGRLVFDWSLPTGYRLEQLGDRAMLAAYHRRRWPEVKARVTGIDTDLETKASIAAARVKVAIEEPALRAASRLFDVGGASSVRASTHLDRHWRNLRTLFSHNPTVYKARVLGDVRVNDAGLPDSSFF